MPKLTDHQNEMRKNDYVQSVLLSKSMYKLVDVCPIVKALGFNCFYIDDSGMYYRVRQFNPKLLRKNPKYKILKSSLVEGVEFIIQY